MCFVKKETSDSLSAVLSSKERHIVAVAVERLSYRRIPRTAKRSHRGVCACGRGRALHEKDARTAFCTTLGEKHYLVYVGILLSFNPRVSRIELELFEVLSSVDEAC